MAVTVRNHPTTETKSIVVKKVIMKSVEYALEPLDGFLNITICKLKYPKLFVISVFEVH